MVAVLSRKYGLQHIDIIMDVVQDTFESALLKWRFNGLPSNPSAWLMQVAKNKAINNLKRQSKTTLFVPSKFLKQFDSSVEQELDYLIQPQNIQDSQLRLLFVCCNPAFSQKNQVIITLNVLCGFNVPEIANALVMNEEAVKKALTRIKSLLKSYQSTFNLSHFSPSIENVKTIHTILYLMFNEGYKTTRAKEPINNDLCYEAIRLTKLLEGSTQVLSSDTNALLSLMFFNISRFPARLGESNELLTLKEQNRNKWNKVYIEEGFYFLNKLITTDTLTRFHIEAIIASLHCSAATFESTNWEKIIYLYSLLEQLDSSPLIKLNKIIAESYLNFSKTIEEINKLEIELTLNNSLFIQVAKADVYARKGEFQNASRHYEKALQLSISNHDKNFLTNKLNQCKLNLN